MGRRWVSLAALLLLLLASRAPREGLPMPACPIRACLGVPCAGCGFTRSLIAAADGDWRTALRLHPLAPVACVGLLAVAVVGLLPPTVGEAVMSRCSETRFLAIAGIMVVALLLINGVGRLIWIFVLGRPSPW